MNQRASSSPAVQERDDVKIFWAFSNVLRDDGVSALEYVEQLAFVLFLKLAHDQRRRPLNPVDVIGFDAWEELRDASGQEQLGRYDQILDRLGTLQGTVGLVFRKAQNRVRDPAKLSRLIELVDDHDWSAEGALDRGAVFEALLTRMVDDVRTGAGQYFSPRPLIDMIVQCVRPTIDDTIIDPACGTGGFLIKSFQYLIDHFPRGVTAAQRARLNEGTIFGNELVDATARLATMNLVLHGVTRTDGAHDRIAVGDSLARTPARRASLVLTTPPFNRASLITVVDTVDAKSVGDFAHSRPDFWATTSSRQLNFLQHVHTLMETDGRAAVVVPDNVLFEGGAGTTIRRRLLTSCDLHTLLRLPTGVFPARGVKTNVLFFDKPAPRSDGSPSSHRLWVYDMRSGHPLPSTAPSIDAGFADFVAAYLPGRPRHERVETSVFRSFGVAELLGRNGVNLDLLIGPREETVAAAEPEVDLHTLAEEITRELRSALADFSALAEALQPSGLRDDRAGRDSAR
ncbi:HsdM family class I SAM-dependent methyltransferase [Streptomyces sp. QTS52]